MSLLPLSFFSLKSPTSLWSSPRGFPQAKALRRVEDQDESFTAPSFCMSIKTAPLVTRASICHRPLLTNALDGHEGPSLCIAVIGATGELARAKIFPPHFALYYSGFLPEDVGIFGYSRNNMTDEDLRSIIASNLTCQIDHWENCGDKMDAFLGRTYYLSGCYDNKEGMSRLDAKMEQIGGHLKQTESSTSPCHKKLFSTLLLLFLTTLKQPRAGTMLLLKNHLGLMHCLLSS